MQSLKEQLSVALGAGASLQARAVYTKENTDAAVVAACHLLMTAQTDAWMLGNGWKRTRGFPSALEEIMTELSKSKQVSIVTTLDSLVAASGIHVVTDAPTCAGCNFYSDITSTSAMCSFTLPPYMSPRMPAPLVWSHQTCSFHSPKEQV